MTDADDLVLLAPDDRDGWREDESGKSVLSADLMMMMIDAHSYLYLKMFEEMGFIQISYIKVVFLPEPLRQSSP